MRGPSSMFVPAFSRGDLSRYLRFFFRPPIFSLRGEKFLGIVSAGDQVYLESEDGKKRIYQYLTACNSKFIYEHLKGQNI